MRLARFTTSMPDAMRKAMAEFEKEFTYPLGDACRFGISHGEDYLAFFRAMGDAELVTAVEDGRVLGSIARVERSVRTEDGITGAHYLCDLKLRAASRGSLVLARLFRETKRIIEGGGNHNCYCVVMKGTGRLPTDYTGRLGIPGFEQAGEIMILRVSGGGGSSNGARIVEGDEFREIQGALPLSGFRPVTGRSELRSAMAPVYLAAPDDAACAVLEDTRLGKRLMLGSGGELLSAHLSDFRYRTPESAAGVIHHAVALAAGQGIPAVFLGIPAGRAAGLGRYLSDMTVTEAPATVHAHGFPIDGEWWIDTAEI